ncbi:MAG: tetratricopeptide repeat protein [Armatimonadetes bacterium]|nr:tetratricopeptide repeat protein [Armatimonadota bacterium]
MRQALLSVRKLVGSRAIHADRGAIGLTELVQSDIQKVLKMEDALLGPHEKLAAARTAADLARGELLEGQEEEWLLPYRIRCGQAAIQAILLVGESWLNDDAELSLVYACRAIALDPYLEAPRNLKVRALRLLGRDVDALRERREFEALLHSELGIEVPEIAPIAFAHEPEHASSASSAQAQGCPCAEAIELLLARGKPREAAELSLTLVPYWVEAGQIEGGIAVARSVLQGATNDPEAPHRPLAWLSIAMLLQAQGQLFDASAALNELPSQGLDLHHQIRTHILRSRIALLALRPTLAAESAQRALRLAKAGRFPSIAIEAYDVASNIALCDERYGLADQYAKEGARLAEQQLDVDMQAKAIGFQALICLRQGNTARGSALAQKGLRLLEGRVAAQALATRTWLFRILEEAGAEEAALAGYESCIRALKRAALPFRLAVALTYYGDLLCRRGKFDQAITHHKAALEIREGLSDAVGVATSLRGIGNAALFLGEFDEAQKALGRSLRIFLQNQSADGEASVMLLMARLALARGRRDQAFNLASRARDLLMGLSMTSLQAIGALGHSLPQEADSLVADLSPQK